MLSKIHALRHACSFGGKLDSLDNDTLSDTFAREEVTYIET